MERRGLPASWEVGEAVPRAMVQPPRSLSEEDGVDVPRGRGSIQRPGSTFEYYGANNTEETLSQPRLSRRLTRFALNSMQRGSFALDGTKTPTELEVGCNFNRGPGCLSVCLSACLLCRFFNMGPRCLFQRTRWRAAPYDVCTSVKKRELCLSPAYSGSASPSKILMAVKS